MSKDRSKKPEIVITMGDPAGIGPEIIIKTLAKEEIYRSCRPIICGSRVFLEKAMRICGLENRIHWDRFCVEEPRIADFDEKKIELGKASADGGKAAYRYIEKATELCMSKTAAAMATAPINKEALKMADIPYIGHTEILAGLTGTQDPLTMFYVHGLKVFFLTRHIAFSQICSMCTEERIYDYIVRCTEAMERMDIGNREKPFAVAALNPHGGDGGLFGSEEKNNIFPAVLRARENGINVVGPIPADSVFHMALKGDFSGVLSLYHDQGHIATKTLDFEKTIAVTCGLPFLRTSVDHGTAFDIAGKGTASEISMMEAVNVAAKLIL